jgi:hypothetical protein
MVVGMRMCVRMHVCTKSSSVAQTISRHLLTIAAHVQSHGCCGQNGTGAGVLTVLIFPLPILIPLTLHFSQLSSGAGEVLRPKYQGTRAVSPHPNNNKSVQRHFIYFLCTIDLGHVILEMKLFLNNCQIPNSNEIRLSGEAGIVKIYISRSCSLRPYSYFLQDITYAVIFVGMTKLQKFNTIHYIHF